MQSKMPEASDHRLFDAMPRLDQTGCHGDQAVDVTPSVSRRRSPGWQSVDHLLGQGAGLGSRFEARDQPTEEQGVARRGREGQLGEGVEENADGGPKEVDRI